MAGISQDNVELTDSERCKAKAAARLIYYVASDAKELGLGDCHQLLRFVANLIRCRYGISAEEAFQFSERS